MGLQPLSCTSFIHSFYNVAVCQGLCSDVRDHENRTDSGLPLERGITW